MTCSKDFKGTALHMYFSKHMKCKEICDILQISNKTLYNWRKQFEKRHLNDAEDKDIRFYRCNIDITMRKTKKPLYSKSLVKYTKLKIKLPIFG